MSTHHAIDPVELDSPAFDRVRDDAAVLARIRRDVESGAATGDVDGRPTLFIDAVVYRGSYDAAALIDALARATP